MDPISLDPIAETDDHQTSSNPSDPARRREDGIPIVQLAKANFGVSIANQSDFLTTQHDPQQEPTLDIESTHKRILQNRRLPRLSYEGATMASEKHISISKEYAPNDSSGSFFGAVQSRQAGRTITSVHRQQEVLKAGSSPSTSSRSPMKHRTDSNSVKSAAYVNPNAVNDLSMMNISHMSNTFSHSRFARGSKEALASPGTFVEGHDAFRTYSFITEEDHEALLYFLRERRCKLDILSMVDSRNFTVLSYAAYRNQTNCFKILFEYGWRLCFPDESKRESRAALFQSWLNTPTEDQFTALHFATRHANLTILTLLVERGGADIYQRNKFGSTVMHIAAQQDQPLSLYYFFKRGMDINIRDSKSSTPLHWACFTRSEMALNYILSMKPDLEAQDSFGFTPLHIAVTCAEKLGSTRTVKALLLRGASRETKDTAGKTPLDHIPITMPEDMQGELKMQLLPQSYWECLMLRVPLIPLKRNHKT